MTQDTNTASGAAIKRYKIGYHTDEWGVRSSTPGGITDPSGQWVLYKDHIAALASHGQAPAQAAPAAVAGPLNELEELNLLNKLITLGSKAAHAHAQSNSDDGHKGTAAYVQWQEMRAEMGELIRAAYAAPTTQPAPQQEAPADELEEVLRERDDAEDFINELLDEVLGADRPEWSSAYNRYDAMSDVRERITALHKPVVDKAWGRFESAMAAPQSSPAAQGDALDAARWHWIAEYLVGPRTDLDDEIVASETVNELRKLVDAARAAQEGK